MEKFQANLILNLKMYENAPLLVQGNLDSARISLVSLDYDQL